MTPKILIVEDNKKLGKLFKEALEEHFATLLARDLNTARQHLSECQGIVLDLQLPDGNGLELIHQARAQNPGCVIIVVTAYGTIQSAVDALRLGAADFLEKPVDLEELCRRFLDFLYPVEAQELVAESPAMLKVVSLARQVAPTPFPVLISGPTGAGKEILARLVHSTSGRKKFLSLNCASVPSELADSLLFGHLKGSFTGASEAREGLVAAADHQTLFLDEIGELPLSLQPKFLRFLDSGEYMPVGSNRTQKSRARIIAATNRDLKNEVENGNFREDLYFRLSTFPINIPPLRQRKEDIVPLVNFHLKRLHRILGRKVQISEGAIEFLLGYRFPGNVRELFNLLDRTAVISGGNIRRENLEDLVEPESAQQTGTGGLCSESRAEAAKMEKEMIMAALAAAGGNKAAAARALRISYKTLFNKMKKYGIDK